MTPYNRKESVLSASLNKNFLPSPFFKAKKVGNELNPSDVTELERISGEQSGLQKQLEALRKQQRQHQMQFQDYRNKQKVSAMGETFYIEINFNLIKKH